MPDCAITSLILSFRIVSQLGLFVKNDEIILARQNDFIGKYIMLANSFKRTSSTLMISWGMVENEGPAIKLNTV